VDGRATHVEDQAAAAREEIVRRARLTGGRDVDALPDELTEVLRRLVSAAEPGCGHMLPGRETWRTTPKTLLYGYLVCTAPECIVRWEARAIEHGLLRSGLPQCDVCGESAETLPLTVTLEGDALTVYLGLCRPCGDAVDELTRGTA
jgi:hypothetical protein